MWDVVAHLALVDAAAGVRDRCFNASPGVQLKVHPWSSMSLPIERTAGVYEHSRSCAERLDVNVDDVRRLHGAVSGT